MKKISVLIILFGFILFSCSPSLYIPESSDPHEQTKLLEGRQLYVSHCSHCHNLHLPGEYSVGQWSLNLNKMQERAKLNNEEKQIIYNYLINPH